jgi:hypothetical protein
MLSRIAVALAIVVILVLAFRLHGQDEELEQLRADMLALRGQIAELGAEPAGAQPSPFLPVPRPSAQAEAPAEHPEPSAAPAPRVPVSRSEVARVESAVLSLLESDHPELREKLKAVVQAEQEVAEHEVREQRRERWIARREARLLELAQQTGINEHQRSAMLTILLGSRDQIAELIQGAETAEAFNAAREKIHALREQADGQIRELLTPEQYDAYQERFDDDDRFGRGERGQRGQQTRGE